MVHYRIPTVLILALFFTLTTVGKMSAQDRRSQRGFEVGQPFPELSFPSLDSGRRASLADFRGKKMLLHIFASW